MSTEGFLARFSGFTAFIPSVVAGVLLILLGLVLGRLLQSFARRLTAALVERLSGNAAAQRALASTNMPARVPAMVGVFTFWLVFLFFAATALEGFGLPVVTSSLSRFIYYLPNVLAAGLIVVAGVVLGAIVRSAVTAATTSARVGAAPIIGRLAEAVVLVLAGVIALAELGIDSSVLSLILTVTLGCSLAAAGLAFGLGARTAMSNIIASHYLPRTHRAGQTVRIDGIQGRIVEITTTSVVVRTDEGSVVIPAKTFGEQPSWLVEETG